MNLRARQPRRKVMAARRIKRAGPTTPNEVWSMDFVSNTLFDGRRFRALTMMDAFTRKCRAIEPDQAIKADMVVSVLDRLVGMSGMTPGKIRVDIGPEFVSRVCSNTRIRG